MAPVTGAEVAASQEHVLADHAHRVAQDASWLLPDLSAAGDEQFVRARRMASARVRTPSAKRALDRVLERGGRARRDARRLCGRDP